MLKQISLAALAAMFITGGAVVANAESGAGLGPSSETDEAALQADYAATHGNVVVTARRPSASMQAYSYSRANGINQKSRQDDAGMQKEHD